MASLLRTVDSVSYLDSFVSCHGTQMACNVRNEVLLLVLLLGQRLLPKYASLIKVGIDNDALKFDHGSNPMLLIGLCVLGCWGGGVERRREIVSSTAEIAVCRAGTVSYQGVERVEGSIDRDLDEIDTKAVALRVSVRKSTRLQDCVILLAVYRRASYIKLMSSNGNIGTWIWR